MWLRAKIFIGYLLLIALLVFIVCFFRKEQTRRGHLRQDRQEQSLVRQQTGQVYAGLLDLATRGETVIVWDSADFQSYRSRREALCASLHSLEIHEPEQQRKTDSLCLLLEKKEQLLGTAMSTFHRLQDVDDIVSEQIPAIMSNVRKSTAVQARPSRSGEPESGNLFSRLFQRKEKKSAYLEQREQAEAAAQERHAAKAASMLRSLDKEVAVRHEAEEERLLAQMDSLYAANTDLNLRIQHIVRDFEREADRRQEARYVAAAQERDRSFRTISGLAIAVSILAILLYIVIHRDLKRKYRYQRELESSDRTNRKLLQSKRDMMLAIAHDLRSPLATICGSAELLPQEEDRRRQSKYLENIRHSSEYMLSLVDTLMDFYLLDTGQARPQPSIFHLEALLWETADSHVPPVREKGLYFSTGFSGTDTVVSGDKEHLRQIVDNLLSNAVKFTDQGSVRLEAEYRGGELHLSVRDTGSGISGEEKEKIFNAFERLDNARNRPGFGIGLAVCHRLVTRMGGTVRVESEEGKGSEFTVLLPLPLADGNSRLAEERPAQSHGLEGTRVLLLDDDIRQLGIAREMFRRQQIACDCCADSSELVERLREGAYDVLLTDIQMPGTDGFAVLELLRSSNIGQARRIPAVALTARMDDEREYLSRGFAGCIRKPFTAESLLEGVAKTITPGKEGCGWQPDFSLILQGEDKPAEMLGIFVSESRKDLGRLHEALEVDDRKSAYDILHKNLPLWESLRLDYPLEELKRAATSDPATWTGTDMERIREIEKAAEKLAAYAEDLQKKTP